MHAHGLALVPALVMGVVGVVVLLWLALSRRVLSLPVAHLHLWREAPVPRVRRSRRTLALVLSLVAFLALIAAAADLRRGAKTDTTVWLVLDGAASREARLQAGGSDRTNLARSRRDALRVRAHDRASALLEGADAQAKVGVVLAGIIPRLFLAPTRDAQQAHRAIDEATARDADESRREPRPIDDPTGDGVGDSDRRFDEASLLVRDLAGRASTPTIEVLRASEPTSPNAALLRVEADRARGTLVVAAFAEDARWDGRLVEVRDVETDQLLTRAALSPSPHAELHGTFAELRLPWQAARGAQHLRFVLHDQRRSDPYPGDDEIHLVVPPARPLRVRRLGTRDTFLDAALKALGPDVVVVSDPPFDVLVAEQAAPASASADPATDDPWSSTPALLFAPPREASAASSRATAPFSGAGEEKMALLEEVRGPPTARHPVLEGLSLADVNVGRLLRYATRTDDEILATVHGRPALFIRRERAARWLVVAFAPGQSDFPLRPSFPLFVSQALRWLGPPAARTLAPGATPREAQLASSVEDRAMLSGRPPSPAWPWLTAVALAACLGLLAHAHRRGTR